MSDNREILVVDDEASVVEVVSLYLEREGFKVRHARDGRAALAALAEQRPALVVLDLMLPHVDGLEIMRRLRNEAGERAGEGAVGAVPVGKVPVGEVPTGEVPVIMLTARSQETDRIYGLELGADDYVTKPFSPAELVARVKAVLRRTQAAGQTPEPEAVTHGELTIDPKTRQVRVRGEAVALTATEFNLLWFMAQHPQQVFSREQLLENVWGFSDYVDSSTVTVHIRRLREKIEVDPGEPQQLLTVWGVGYRFQPEE